MRSLHLPGTLFAIAALLTVFAAACGDEAEPEASGALTVTCALEVEPPSVGQNALVIEVRRDGQPVTDAVLTVDPQMPMMGHGSTETPGVTHEGGGIYRAFPVTFQMPGYWEVTVTAVSGEDEGTDLVEIDVPAS